MTNAKPFSIILLLAALCALLWGTQDSYAQGSPTTGWVWPTTEWVLDCPRTEPNGSVVDRAACCQQVGLEPSQCKKGQPDSPAAAVAAQLEEASRWLRDLGFRKPEVTRDGRPPRTEPYPYHFVLGGDEIRTENDVVYGYYENSESGGKLVVDATHYFVMGDEAENATATPTHELFHAIQASYPFYDTADTDDDAWEWIIEGTAAVVEAAWLRRTDGGYGESTWPYGRPLYDYPLHEPKDENLQEYARGHFWGQLGRLLDDPAFISYLHPLFADKSFDIENPLEAVDQALRQFDSDGLYTLYPRFIARSANHVGFFDEVTSVKLTIEGRQKDEYRGGASPKAVAAQAFEVVVDIPIGKIGGLKITVDDHSDLHLIVDRDRYDVSNPLAPEGDFERNVYRGAFYGDGTPDTLLVRVTNVAEKASESTWLFGHEITMTLESIAPCSPEAMTAALNEEMGLLSNALQPDDYDPDEVMRPGEEGTISISGLVSDGGGACTYHLSALDAMGAAMVDAPNLEVKIDKVHPNIMTGMIDFEAMAGKVNPEAAAKAMKEHAEAMQQRSEQSELQKYGSMSEEELQNLLPEERQKLVEMAAGAKELAKEMMQPPKEQEDVVINVFSPHAGTWQSGHLPMPRSTAHGGMEGWSKNAAAHLVMQLEGTRPEDLKEGGTYEATAHAPVFDAPAGGRSDVVFNKIGFYTQWEGEFQGVPYPPPRTPEQARRQAESKRRCKRVNQEIRQMVDEWNLSNPDPEPFLNCRYREMAFAGTLQILAGGRLSGTVTVEELTGAEVKGAFELSGTGTLYVQTWRFTYDKGRLRGSRMESGDLRRGAVTMRGTFSAPNHTGGLPRSTSITGYQTVVIE